MAETIDPTPAGRSENAPPPERGARRRGRPLSVHRLTLSCFKFVGALMLLAVVGMGLVTARMAQGPVKIDGLGDKIAGALQDRFGRGARFALGDTYLVQRGFGPSLRIDRLQISGPDGQAVLSAPKAEVSVDPFALLLGKVVPRRLEVFDVTLRVAMLKNGHLALAAGEGAKPFFEIGGRADATTPTQQAAAAPAATPSRRAIAMKEAGAALRQFMDVLTDSGSAIAAVDRLGVARGTLVIEDQATEQKTTYKDLDLSFDRSHGKTMFSLAADGPSGRWSVSALAAGRPGAARSFSLKVDRLSIDELQLLTGSRSFGFETDMPVAMTLDMALKPDNDLGEAVGGFKVGPGFLRLDDPDQEPDFVTSFDGGFRWNAQARTVDVESLRYVEADGTHFTLGGKVTPPRNEGEPWQIGLATSEPGILAPDRKDQKPVAIKSAAFAGRLELDRKTFLIDRFAVRADPGGVAFAGAVDWVKGPHIRLGGALDPTPVTTVERAWPAFMASAVRAWILTRFEAGTVTNGTLKIDYDQNALLRMRSDRAPPDASVALDFGLTNAKLRFLDGVPELDKIEAHAHITGRTTHFQLTSGTIDVDGRPIAVKDGLFVVTNSNLHPAPASFTAHLSGSVEAVTNILSRDALKPYASIPLDPATLHGDVDGQLTKALLLGPGASSANAPLTVDAKVSSFVAEHLVGKENLENAAVQIAVANGALKAIGQGRIFGGPASFEINRVGSAPPTAAIVVTLDDAARAKVGITAIPGITGPMTAHVNASLGDPSKIRAQVALDLTRTSIAAGLLNLNKAAGRPAKIDFTVQPGEDRMLIEPIALDVGTLQGRGGIELDGDNGFKSAHFSSLRISPGDDMKVDVAKADDGVKLTIRGSTIDARPFLKALTTTPVAETKAMARSAKAEKTGLDGLGGFDVDLKSGLLTGFNRQVMSGVDLKLAKRGPQIREFSVQGRFGRDAVSGTMDAAHRIRIVSRDAGALVSFVDLYKHMEGGQLAADMTMDGETLGGNLEIHDFVLRDEPAIRSLVARSTTLSAPGQDEEAARRINGNDVQFTRLKVDFERDGSRLELSDATMYGPEIGLSVDGWLDYSHNRVGMNGTFVPAFAFNNLFSQIPVLGTFLGGKSTEGLLAITFKISGAAGSPTLTINPLSAVTPGFLRSIFNGLDTPGMQIPTGGEDTPYR